MRRYNIVNFFFDITYLNYSELKIVAIQTAFVLKGLGWTYISQYFFYDKSSGIQLAIKIFSLIFNSFPE